MKKAAYMELLPLLNETNLPTEYNKQIASLFASEGLSILYLGIFNLLIIHFQQKMKTILLNF